MIDYSAIILEKLIIHKAGNKGKNIKNFISNTLCRTDEDLSANLINYFLTPFSKHGEVYKFKRGGGESGNKLLASANKLFSLSDDFQKISVDVLNHLYELSDNPNIKTGELFVVYFKDIIFDDKLTNAVGIFKVERKQNYFSFSENRLGIDIDLKKGASARRIDKGCLIINIEEDDGYRVLSMDNNNYDTEYWKNNFLNLEYVRDFYYHTSNYVDFCKSFSEDVIVKEKGKDEQIAFLNKSMNYLSKKEEFDLKEFAEEIFDEPVKRQEFFDYKNNFETEREVEVQESFPISQNTLKVKKRAIKSLINLDTNIQIKLDSKDPETTRQYIEKGYDRERDMHYYKVFYYSEMG